MRKYLTAASVSRVVDSQAKQRSAGTQCATALERIAINVLTIIYLLESDDTVRREALLCVLI
jgi:hypothetical protein